MTDRSVGLSTGRVSDCGAVAITATTRMELRVTGGAATSERPLVAYVAWPGPDGGSGG